VECGLDKFISFKLYVLVLDSTCLADSLIANSLVISLINNVCYLMCLRAEITRSLRTIYGIR